MARESLLQMLEDLASKVKSLEQERKRSAAALRTVELERDEALAKAKRLDREVGELIGLVNLAGAKIQEILQIGPSDEVTQAVGLPTESAGS